MGALSWILSESLKPRQRKLIEDEDINLLLSTVSLTEIAVKARIKKLAVNKSDLLQAASDLRLIVLPFESRHASRIFDLPLHHRDPFDPC